MVWKWLKTATMDDLKTFKATTGEHIYHVSVGPKDILYMPAAYVFLEQVGHCDFVGIRALTVQKSQFKALEALQKLFMGLELPPSKVLTCAVDSLALAD